MITKMDKKALAALKHNKKLTVGFRLLWKDKNPLDTADIYDYKACHRSPILRLMAGKFWQDQHDFVLSTVFQWKIAVAVVFLCEGKNKIEVGEFSARYAHSKNSVDMCNQIEKFISAAKLNNFLVGEQKGTNHKNYGEYSHCEYLAEIVGV